MPMSGHTRRDGQLSLHWALTGCGDPTTPGERASPQPDPRGHPLAPLVQVDAQTRVVNRSLAEHRVCFGVGHEFPHLLRAAASGGDLGSPRQRLLACGYVDDREPAYDLLGLRVRPVGDQPVRGHDARPLPLEPAAVHLHAGDHGLLDHLGDHRRQRLRTVPHPSAAASALKLPMSGRPYGALRTEGLPRPTRFA